MRTQGVAATLFPLLVLSGLALLAFWLSEAVTPSSQPDDAAKRHAPDAIAENFILYRYNTTGKLAYRLEATRMEHYPDDDSSLIYTPRLIRYRPNLPDVTMTAQSAHVTTRGEQVLLRDDVVIVRGAYANRPELIAKTPELTVLPEEGKAFNQHPVAITQGKSWVNGIGLLADNDLKTFTLRKSVRGEYTRTPSERPRTP